MSTVATSFKTLASQGLFTASLNLRIASFHEVEEILKDHSQAIPDSALKALAKILPAVLTRLRDRNSRMECSKLVNALLDRSPQTTPPVLLQAIWDNFQHWRNLVSSPGSGKTAVSALKWMEILFKYLEMEEKGSQTQHFCELLAILVTVIFGSGKSRLAIAAQKILKKIWVDNVNNTKIMSKVILKSCETNQQSLVLASYYVGYLVAENQSNDVENAKKVLLDSLVKSVISNKVKVPRVITQNLGPFLKQVNHEEFKGCLLPPMQKAMLRNPETILRSIGNIFNNLSIDLSQYVMELLKPFGANLHAKDKQTRDDAIFATVALAKQCSDAEAISKLLKHLFDLLGGSEGKITVNDQKCSLLEAIGGVSVNAVTGSTVENTCTVAFEASVKILDSEVHEGTLVEVLNNLSLWSNKLSKEIPIKFIQWLPKGLSSKTSTSTVRIAYLSCLSKGLKSNTLTSALPLVPILMKYVSNASTQSSQVSAVSEGVLAASCLIKLSALEADMKESLDEFWKIILDSNKQLFCNQRFLLAASHSAMNGVISVAEHVITAKLTEPSKQAPWMRALMSTLLSNNKDTRIAAGLALDRMFGRLGESLACIALEELYSHLSSDQVTLGEEGKDSDQTNAVINPKFVMDGAVRIIKCCIKGNKKASPSCISIAKRLLNVCHFPGVQKAKSGIWKKLFNALEPSEEQRQEFYSNIVEEILKGNVDSNAIVSLVADNPDGVVPEVVKRLKLCLNNSNLLISEERYQIYLTPKGDLFNKQILEQIENSAETKNIKRENKAYSYKEQMEEIALRKELEEKKRKEGKMVAPKLTPKQKELLDTHLEKEDQIRQEVHAIKEDNDPIINLASIAIKADPKPFAPFTQDLTSSLFNGLKSPIFATQCCVIFTDLRKSVFDDEDDLLSQLIASMILQIHSPSCQMIQGLKSEDILDSSRALIQKISEATLESAAQDPDLACPFTTPAFCFSFPILKFVLTKSFSDENVSSLILNIISEHVQLRGVGEAESLRDIDSLHPKYLPTNDILKVLIESIEMTDARVQQMAVACLIETGKSLSGQPGCDRIDATDFSILLGGTQNSTPDVRDACLRTIDQLIPSAMPSSDEDIYHDLLHRLYIAKFEVVEETRSFADLLWQKAGLQTHNQLCFQILTDIIHPVGSIREAASDGLAELLENQPNDVETVLTSLLDTYNKKLIMTLPVMDHLGRVVQEPVDSWESRSGIAVALKKMAPFYNVQMVETIASFLVPTALDDRNELVRNHVLEAAVEIINNHGKDTADKLLPIFENFMGESAKSAKFDHVRQSIVILMGSMAKHLDPSDPKVRPIMRQLIIALNTPSQQVQEAVAQCLPPLVPTIKEEAPEIVTKLIDTLFGSKNSFGERKGAAYGIAGIVKGLGILSLKQLDIMSRLTEAIQDKKVAAHREGALFAFEMLCVMLGRLFEPYIVHILPHLLLCFGDQNDYVRKAANETAKAVMRKLSAHGVKLILPSLLNALEVDQWRTKSGSVELLGSMAFCAPKQLSSCLPSIVPKLIEVLGDSHYKVQKAGEQALKKIGSVIRNPEIQAIVPVLLKALENPAKKTGICLQTLLETKFVHFIDAPSLALIMPVVQRAFQDRSTETRKMAAQVIGNMYSLTDQKDLSPYLSGTIPGLKNSLLDPVPEVRAVSARALGAMVKGMGEASFEELLPWLMSTLTSETSSVDRSGAAQGLAEVVGGLGVEKMNALMPDIVKTAERQDIAPHVKDGYIMMFIYMPAVFPDEFTPYIAQIISPVLRALADENEFVRETAYKAGQRLVTAYAENAITLLLPELEKGMFDDNWRIRHSSVQLLGDLLYKISGVTGKMSTETAGEDDNFGTEHSQRAIFRVLGTERRNRVLAGLYMGRSDVALLVRQASLHVWKVIVSNTPKTLKEILPTLFNLLLGCLASNSYDKRQVAARTLGDLVKKLGERVLPEIIPILEKGLESAQPEKRQGVCVGLSEIMSSTSRDMVMTFVDSLVPTVRRALCDDLPEVREAAAKSFDSLHNTVGSRALDDILPIMLKQLDDDALHDNTLDGLKQVMAIKSRAVLPYLIPQLIAKPVNTKALASLAPVAGEAIHKHLTRILPALLYSMNQSHGTDENQVIQEHAEAVILSISDDESDVGVRIVLEELLTACKSDQIGMKRGAITLMNTFCSQTKVDYSQYVSQLIRSFILLFTEEDQEALTQAWNALSAVTKGLNANEQMSHVGDIRQAVKFAMMDLKSKELLPGFCLPKGIQPILPIFRESILNGPPELKEQAALGLGEVINVTSAAALKLSVVHITGPLIRILGDRFSHGVKTAILDTLGSLLCKAKDMLKPFFPQLQTTFLKSLNDVNRSVRLKSGIALSYLITIHMRPDPIFNDLLNGIKSSDDTAIRDTYLQALRGCLEPSGKSISVPIRTQMLTILMGFLSHGDDSSRIAGSGCLASLCKWLPDEDLKKVLESNILVDNASLDWTLRHGRSTALFATLKLAPERICEPKLEGILYEVIRNYLTADRIPIVENGVRAVGYLFEYHIKTKKDLPGMLIAPYCKALNHSSNEVKLLVAIVATHLATCASPALLPEELLKPLLPMLVNGTKEKNSAVKSSSESSLVAVLQLRNAKGSQNECLAVLDPGARNALKDVIEKVLQRVAKQPLGKEEIIDNTVLLCH